MEGRKHSTLLIAFGVARELGVPREQAEADLFPIVAKWPTKDTTQEAITRHAERAYSPGEEGLRPRPRPPHHGREAQPQGRPQHEAQEMEERMITPRARTTLIALALAALLAACAPVTSTTTVRPPTQPPLTAAEHYHPNEPGVTLTYLDAEGAEYQLVTLAPRLLSGIAYQHQQYEGPGISRSTYRLNRPEALLLARIDTEDAITTYDPPILELPGEGRLTVGLRWGGDTTERTYSSPTATTPDAATPLAYLSEVTDGRNIRVGNDRVTVFLIATEEYRMVDDVTVQASHERWYAPFFGDIINREGHELVTHGNR